MFEDKGGGIIRVVQHRSRAGPVVERDKDDGR